jgi:Pyruvate:ferredoxin oxidoreductase and related 2-oxoacid:ferredoxin oxidoreductases, beta subunit
MIIAAINHKGLAFVDVLQPCPTYNDINTRDWFNGVDRKDETTQKPMSRIYKLEDTDYDPVVHYSDETELNQKKTQAIVKSLEWDNQIPTGIFYKNELITPYTRRLVDKIPNYIENPSALQNISKNHTPITKINEILDLYKV